MRLEIGNHFAERRAADLFGGFHVHVFLRHDKTARGGVFFEELDLSGDREALLLLLL
jgi:hypothetical protein